MSSVLSSPENDFMDADMMDELEGEEGGGWDVDEDDLELPADLVSVFTGSYQCSTLRR